MKELLSLFLLLGLTACASAPSVQVRYARATPISFDQPLNVQAENDGLKWAAETALKKTGWDIQSSSTLTLRVFETENYQVRTYNDPFCDPWGWGPRGFYGYRGVGWGHGPYYGSRFGCSPPDTRVIPARTLTWSLEDGPGQVLWAASTRELNPMGPPIELSDRLAQALIEWQRKTMMPE